MAAHDPRGAARRVEQDRRERPAVPPARRRNRVGDTNGKDNSVAFAGASITAPVNGVPITISFGPAGPTAGTPATATVTQGPLAVSAFPIVGTEGIAIPAGPIATFIDAGGADPFADYSATARRLHLPNAAKNSRVAGSGNFIDQLIYKKLAADGVLPAPSTTDAEFLRRITLDLAGRIPSPDQAAWRHGHDGPRRATAPPQPVLHVDRGRYGRCRLR